MIYFAYGSNLDQDQMRSRCASARAIGRATLPNHALVFGGFSHRWGGAVASVVREPGASVEGLLYELDEADLRTLDRFEGHPSVYRRISKFVLDECGQKRRAVVYVLPAEILEQSAPSSDYLGVLHRAYVRLGFDLVALGLRGPTASTKVFVYGTLLSGEPNHRLLTGARFVVKASTGPEFELRDLGAFPGLVRGGALAIVGEVYEVDAPTLAALDRLEGHPSFYRRTRIRLDGGEIVQAYLLAPEQVDGYPVIRSGSWREHRRGRRQ